MIIDISKGSYLVKGHLHEWTWLPWCFWITLCFPMYDVETLWTEWVTCWTAILVNGRWSLKVPCQILLCIHLDSWCEDTWNGKWPLLCNLLSLSLGVTNNVFKVLVPLKYTCIPLAWQTFLNFSPVPWMYGTIILMFLLLLVGWLLVLLLLSVLVELYNCPLNSK